MSAIVCGKRSFFEELQAPSPAKKLRCSSSSPVRFSPPPPPVLDRLREVFPNMDNQILEEVLEQCGNDLDAAIKRLYELSLGHVEGNPGSVVEANANMEGPAVEANADMEDGAIPIDGGEVPSSEKPSVQINLPANGAEWVELIVKEMAGATSIDDARSRAARVLESFQKSILSRVGAEATQTVQKENMMMLKEQLEVVLRENTILKRAVAIQHERHKEYDDRVQEVQQLKQLLAQYQEQLRTLEVNNYALAMHLRQAQQNNPIIGRYNPDVF